VSGLIDKAALDEQVMMAIGKLPRHEFVPIELRPHAYANIPLLQPCRGQQPSVSASHVKKPAGAPPDQSTASLGGRSPCAQRPVSAGDQAAAEVPARSAAAWRKRHRDP
jgi:hypothetical protein